MTELEHLPDDIMNHVLSFLDITDVLALKSSNRGLRSNTALETYVAEQKAFLDTTVDDFVLAYTELQKPKTPERKNKIGWWLVDHQSTSFQWMMDPNYRHAKKEWFGYFIYASLCKGEISMSTSNSRSRCRSSFDQFALMFAKELENRIMYIKPFKNSAVYFKVYVPM